MMTDSDLIDALLKESKALVRDLSQLTFSAPVSHVYNPLEYAWAPFERYVRRFAALNHPAGRVVMLGMNPGPFGMAQVGVPFGEVAAVRDWMGIQEPVLQPALAHPKRPIQGFDCPRSEVSGRRLWSWAAEEMGSAEQFFRRFFVLNYCPLIWLEASGKNRTPEQIPADQMRPVYERCDQHLRAVIELLRPVHCIGIGGFAQKRLMLTVPAGLPVGMILHPSPASPAANRGWAQQARQQLVEQGIL